MERTSLAEFQPLPEGAEQYPLEYIEGNAAVKLRDDPGGARVGVCDPADAALLENLRQFHHGQVTFYQIDRGELTGWLGGRLARGGSASTAAPAPGTEKLALDQLANDAPVVNLVNSILSEAIRRDASDIHIEAFAERAVVRYRLDGILQTVAQVEHERFAAVATRLKIMANLNIMERRRPQDGRITVHLGDDRVDLRVSVIPIANGESFVLRVFNRRRSPLTLEQLGMSDAHLAEVLGMTARPNGLVLINGPTGSGKTTTLNAVLERIRSDAKKIVTIEDPIEYLVDGVSQIQTNERIGLGFDTLLRRVLRQDPNIIMVGEIRDTQTAELAVRAALTGHLVLSTLHTRDAVSVVTRLKNMGVEPYLVAAVLRGSVAQRLVRRLCPDCRRERAATPAEAAQLARHGLKAASLHEAPGCKACHQTGFRGRMGLFELFSCDAEVEDLIAAGRHDAEIRRLLAARGMATLLADGLQKVLRGLTTLAELEGAVAG
jgi:general secretion pathway protein E/type IV pilus assembly protein PilB